MTVISRAIVNRYLNELDDYYKKLRSAVEGWAISDLDAKTYISMGRTPSDVDEFKGRYLNIDLNQVETEMKHFKVQVEALKQLKTYKL